MTGYIPISRKLFNHPFWTEKREYSRAEAWIDLLRSVRFEASPGRVIIGNKTVVINRGEMPVSLRYLAERWQWSKNKADAFLNLLVNEGMICKRTAPGTVQTVVAICKYESYNQLSDDGQTLAGQGKDGAGTLPGQAGDKSNKGKKDNKEKEDKVDETLENLPDVALRRQRFYESLAVFAGKYSKGMLREFFDYWTELTPSGRKMRFELQKTWENSKRLATWAAKAADSKSQSRFTSHHNQQTYEEF